MFLYIYIFFRTRVIHRGHEFKINKRLAGRGALLFGAFLFGCVAEVVKALSRKHRSYAAGENEQAFSRPHLLRAASFSAMILAASIRTRSCAASRVGWLPGQFTHPYETSSFVFKRFSFNALGADSYGPLFKQSLLRMERGTEASRLRVRRRCN